MTRRKQENGLVYSTQSGRMCPRCGRKVDACICRERVAPADGDGIVRLMRQTKGRKGKGVTLISGLVLPAADLKKLAKSLKQKCGCGGSIKNGLIEIQGDHRPVLEQELTRLGYKVKRAGG